MGIMSISACSVGLSVAVLNMHYGADRGRAPRWLRVLTFDFLGRLFGHGYVVKSEFLCERKLAGSGLCLSLSLGSTLGLNLSSGLSLGSSLYLRLGSSLSLFLCLGLRTCCIFFRRPAIDQFRARNAIEALEWYLNECPPSGQQPVLKLAAEVLTILQEQARQEMLVHEWADIARIFDTAFFLIIVFISLVITITFIIILPYISYKS